MSFDVWDALESERHVPIPKLLRDPTEDTEEEAAPHALPRRFWAKALKGAIARSYAVQLWTSMRVEEEAHTFDDVLLGFSAFMDVSPKEILAQLDDLASRCRQQLIGQGRELDPQNPRYDLRALILSVREFMQCEGFAVATGQAFLNPYNQFPPHLLGPGRSATIPMSMNWVFAAICRRIGVQAGPTNTPGKVLCHIRCPDSEKGDMLFDVCADTPPKVFSSRTPDTMLAEAGMTLASRADAVRPASLGIMVRRAAYNIFHVTRMGQFEPGTPGDPQRRADYAASVALASVCDPREVQAEPGRPFLQALPPVPPDCPLDKQAVLLDMLPYLPQAAHADPSPIVGPFPHCRATLDPPKHRPYAAFGGFVGQVVSMGANDLGCIFGWEIVERVNRPPTSIYYVLSRMGIIPCHLRDFSQVDLAPLTVEGARRLRAELSCFDQYFEDVAIPREDGVGGRLIPSVELQTAYPDDLEYGARWTEQELERAGSTGAVVA
ncbi:hypothetical protein BV20DRAFT_933736 [Pilatotrama ljubarskyi]|nr:hypothetical protein BV20DRAFT_933736 [Pilatotrama ljubarskyi]